MKAVVAMKLLEAGPFDLKALENLRAGRQELLKVAAAAGEPGYVRKTPREGTVTQSDTCSLGSSR